MTLSILLVVAGVAILCFGGDVMVRHSTALASALRVTPRVIGLTVVAFGTSAPELATASLASARGASAIAVGNVVGSNIANIGLILGLTVFFMPLLADRGFVLREVVFMILSAVLLVAFVGTGELARWQAIVLLFMMAFFMRMLLRDTRSAAPIALTALITEVPVSRRTPLVLALFTLGGIVLLVFGAELLVRGASALARDLGVSERIIGLTLVAVGTSLPELAASVIAALRNEADLVIGNIVGSNIFNTLFILPTAILIRPIPATFEDFGFDLVAMMVASVALFVFFLSGNRLNRLEGAGLLAGYGYYVYAITT